MPDGPGSLLAAAGPRDLDSLATTIAGIVRAQIGAGPLFLAAADPATGAFTGTFLFDISPAAGARFLANESAGGDVLTFRHLASAPVPVGSLFAETNRQPRSSARWRDIIEPLGWGDELRAAVRCGGSIWGYMCLHREAGERAFTQKDAHRLARLLPALGTELRRAAQAPHTDSAALGSGVVLIDSHERLIGTTGAAAEWIDLLGAPLPSGLPLIVAALVRRVFDSGRPATVLASTRTGSRAMLEAAALNGETAPQVVVVISAARPAESLRRLALAAQLTAREQQVVATALAGRSTRSIAGLLGISEHTVQAHLTSVFAKTGVRSRRELIGRLGA